MIAHVSDVKVPPPRPGKDQSRLSELDAAYARVAVAYRLARRAVFDLYPDGVPDETGLTNAQRVLLSALRDAELELDELRRLRSPRSGDADHPIE